MSADLSNELADKIERADPEAFAWLLDAIFDDPQEAEDAQKHIIAVLRQHAASGVPTMEQVECAIDHCEPAFIETLTTERETWIADNMRHEILTKVRAMRSAESASEQK